MPAFVDLTGHVFHRLTVLRQGQHHRRSAWVVRCQCGTEKVVTGSDLRSGATTSCGCQRRESLSNMVTHGHTRGRKQTAEYIAWGNMIDRCHNEKNIVYHHYGAKGIRVCDDWRGSFDSFLAHIGMRPSAGHSIDRIDGSRGYEPGNVRWATRKEQNRNRSICHMVTFGDETLTMSAWCERLHISSRALRHRLRHWPITRAMTEPVRKTGRNACAPR